MVSEQEKYRARAIREKLDQYGPLDDYFFTCDLGHQKSEPQFFREVLDRLQLKPEEVMYWDDDQKNVDVAKSVGIDAHFYRSLEEMKKVTNDLIHV